ncbi:MAG: hypothetical protein DSY88_03655 [Candidatus Poseidoniales archaeon]|nr:MAG: hypothetical protein DSY88_03655 [Candidatus Poseidoniales archaeon]
MKPSGGTKPPAAGDRAALRQSERNCVREGEPFDFGRRGSRPEPVKRNRSKGQEIGSGGEKRGTGRTRRDLMEPKGTGRKQKEQKEPT